MAKKGQRTQVGLQCVGDDKKPGCKNVTYVTQRNKQNTPDALVLKKYCKICKARTVHKERKKLH